MVKFKRVLGIAVIVALLIGSSAPFITGISSASAQPKNPYLVSTFVDDDGNQIDEVIVPGRPPEIKVEAVEVPEPNIEMGINTLTEVPAFDWSYGCSPTAAAMLFGYYDRTGYSNMYTGPTDGGVCPLDNSVWGETVYPGVICHECPLSATHEGVDGRTSRGYVGDYWIDYLDPGPDPWIVNGWTQHTHADCTGDFMGTSQSAVDNMDGGTTFYYYTNGDPLYDFTGYEPDKRDGCHGLRLFTESRSYSVTTNFTQYIKGQGSIPIKGFTFDDFVAEIDAGRPVLIHVVGHTMLGYGYDTADETIYIRDTWDHSNHQMTWGEDYNGLLHKGVTVIHIQQDSVASVSIEPDTQEVAAGGTFNIDVVVDSAGIPIATCDVTVSFDADLAATGLTGADLLGAEGIDALYIPTIYVGEVVYAGARIDGPLAVNGNFVTINFDVDPDATGTYDLVIDATLLDEGDNPIAVVKNNGQVDIGTSQRKGDFDGNGVIDIYDFYQFANAYGSEVGDPNYNVIGDFNDDGYINIYDFAGFADVYCT